MPFMVINDTLYHACCEQLYLNKFLKYYARYAEEKSLKIAVLKTVLC